MGIHPDPSRMKTSIILVLLALAAVTTAKRKVSYAVSETAMSWPEARQYCIANGYKMAKISDEVEQQRMTAFLNTIDPARKKFFWLGLNDRETENTFLWRDGSSTSYRNWRRNQPDNANGNEDCVDIDANTKRTWNDIKCDIKKP